MKKRTNYVLLLFVFLLSAFVLKAQDDPNTPLFEIKNDAGQTVFAVYPGGVHIFIDDSQLKATGGGFRVGRIGTEKATSGDIFTVDPGEVNVFLDNALKATGGGFRVGRIGTEKATGSSADYFKVTPDSTRVYVSETSKNGFAVGKLGEVGSIDFLNLTPDNYLIGHRAGDSLTTGLYNTFIGYQAGVNTTSAKGNVFLGFDAGRRNIIGEWNIFIGNSTGYLFTGEEDGEENIFIGNNAGYNCKTTANSIFIGTRSGFNCGQSYGNTFVGDRTAANGTAGDNNTIIGSMAGFKTSGSENVFVGAHAGVASTSGINNTYIGFGAGGDNIEGNGNIFIGHNAGGLETGSEKLYIANSDTKTPLIFGDFAESSLNITGSLLVNGEIISPSDQRLKTNILKFTKGLEVILALNSYYFDWNDIAKNELGLTDKRQVGVLAQELEKIMPELVVRNSKNGYKSVDYVKLTPVIIQAIKEQNTQITDLEKRIENLEKLNQALMKDMEKVEELKTDIEYLKKVIEEMNKK